MSERLKNNIQEYKDRKYFFFDIDRTLVPNMGDQTVPESTRSAINMLQEKGNFCAIATGRPQYMSLNICDQLGIDNLVSDGGNGITINGTLKSLCPMPHEACVELANQCDEKGYPWAICTENRPIFYTGSKKLIDYINESYINHIFVSNLNISQYFQIYRMIIICEDGEETKISSLAQMNWERITTNYIVVEPGNKEKGIRKIMDYLCAPYDKVVVFGDGINDISMFQPEWINIAMGNAIPEVKAKADFITLNSSNGGILYALKHYGWI